MAHKMRHYDVAEYNNLKKQQGKNFNIPPRANFLAAVNHLRDFFEAKKFAYGFMCGMQMLCLGYKREMPDVHIAYDDRDFTKIKAKLESNQRVRLPDGMNSLFPSKILVRTGPEYRDPGCDQTITIEVDLIPPGSHGTPPMGALSQNLVLLSYRPDGKLRTYKGLNMIFLLRSLVDYCRSSDLAWDPRKDILFLCQHYADDVRVARARLDLKAVQQNFLGTPFFSRLSFDDQRLCYDVLLGKEPPPAMAITPPALTDALPQSARSHMSKYPSTPSLNSKTSVDLLNLPQAGRPAVNSQVAELASPPNPMVERAGAQESRSRYRPISAPGSRTNSPESRQPDGKVRPASMDMRQTRQPAMLGYNNAPSNSQSGMALHAQHPSSLVATSYSTHERNRSMPSMDINYRRQAGYQSQAPFQPSPLEVSATPVPFNPGQEYLKSQLGLGGDYLLPHMRAENNRPITTKPVPPSSRTAYTVPQQPIKVEQPDSAVPKSQHGSLHGINATETTNLPIRGEDIERKLRLVGLEGLYGAPHIGAGSGAGSGSTTKAAQNLSRGPQSSFVFELDATPLHNSAMDLTSSINAALSELHKDGPSSNSTRSKTEPQPKLEEPMNAMSLNLLNNEANSTGQSALGQHIERPVNPRIHSAPATILPTSLMIGGTATRHHPHPAGSQDPVPTTTAQITTTQTNASRYSRYYSSPTITPNSTGSSPELKPAPLSVYKAYQPATMLQSQDAATDTNRSRPTSLEVSKDRWRTHKRDASRDSQFSNASHDSSKLAQEYQAELPGFEHGYGMPAR